jgi:hypothetical protein
MERVMLPLLSMISKTRQLRVGRHNIRHREGQKKGENDGLRVAKVVLLKQVRLISTSLSRLGVCVSTEVNDGRVEMMKGRDVGRIMVRRVMKNLKLEEGGRYL